MIVIDDLVILIIFALVYIYGITKAINAYYRGKYEKLARTSALSDSSRRKYYDQKSRELEQRTRELNKQRQVLTKKAEELSLRESKINAQIRERIAKTVVDISKREYLSSTPVYKSLIGNPDPGRIVSALSQNMHLRPPFDISSHIESESGEVYMVTLHSCSCPDFSLHRRPCKHMYRLAAEVGTLLAYDTSSQREQVLSLNQQAIDAERIINNSKKTVFNAEKVQIAARKESNAVKQLLTETSQSYPWLAELYADCIYVFEGQLEQEMRNKIPPAKSSADKLKIIRNDKRQLAAQCKSLEYQLHFYESLFPWLEDFKEVPPTEAYQIHLATTDETAQTDYDYFRNWISPDEYNRLSPSERLQLKLDRIQLRKKSNWEIGIEYERYIGYLCQQRGFRVEYSGAKLRFEDMGRDLIITKEDTCYIIQCKRWAIEKTIHEKHIFQLFGSCIMYETQHPTLRSVTGVFVTTTSLSPVALQCAKRLGIQVFERIPFETYPVIKCNISKNGEKIYHIPGDQQYDFTVIDPNQGEFFASTIAEADAAGFRHAWRHKNKN